MTRHHPTNTFLDRALDFTVLPGYSRLGFRLRGLDRPAAAGHALAGRTVLLTGGSSGLGEAACGGFLRAGARVHLLARDPGRGAEAMARIRDRVPLHASRLQLELCDLSDLASVRRFAEDFHARCERLDVLVNNAGVMPAERRYTADGIELTFATNVVGPFLLTSLLLPALLAAARARVVTVSSGGMYTARIDADDPQLEQRPYDGPAFYAHAKRAQVALNTVWAEQLEPRRIAFHVMHPGWVDTPGLRASLPRFRRLTAPILRDAEQGADTIVWLGAEPDLEPASGALWHDRRPRPLHRVPWTRENAGDRRRLWDECDRLSTGAKSPSAVPG